MNLKFIKEKKNWNIKMLIVNHTLKSQKWKWPELQWKIKLLKVFSQVWYNVTSSISFILTNVPHVLVWRILHGWKARKFCCSHSKLLSLLKAPFSRGKAFCWPISFLKVNNKRSSAFRTKKGRTYIIRNFI